MLFRHIKKTWRFPKKREIFIQKKQLHKVFVKVKDVLILSENREGISRAYENIGRVYARNGKYKDAIDVWERKLPFAETNMEKAWLYHEIGRCHLETGNYSLFSQSQLKII